VTFSICLQCTLDKVALTFTFLHPPFKRISTGFIVLFHVSMYSISTIFTCFTHFPSTLPLVPPLNRTQFFIFKYVFIVQRGFMMVPHLRIYCILLYLMHFSHPSYSTAFSVFCYAIFLHRYNVFGYYSLSLSFLPLLLLVSKSSPTIENM
jgi:hypothetical protein